MACWIEYTGFCQVVVGAFYLAPKCPRWRVDLAGVRKGVGLSQ